MMREIKFRAWDRKHNEWLGADAWFVHSSESVLVVWPQVEKGFEVSVHMETLGVDRIALMQYTGLKDKNGVEIYEGDIYNYFAYPDSNHTARKTVAWAGTARYTGFNISKGHSGNQLERIEIIGNIYENPELLEKL